MAVNIRVNADTRAARRDLSRLEGSVKSIDKTTKNVSRSLTRLASGIAAAFGSAVAVKGINKATDSLINLENRIALVTGRTEQLGISLNNLYSIARQSRQSVNLAGETFNRFGLALKSTGASVSDIEKATLSVQRALTLSGGTAESASAAIFQLGQGLASGTLRGQELNSVLEQAPRIARAIADNLGVAQGELRAMAAEGQITTDVVFNALLEQSGKLEKEFSNLEQTSSQAFVVFSDSLGRVTGQISRGLGFTNLFTRAFNSMTASLVRNGESFELGVYAKFAEFGLLVSDLTPLFVATGGVLNAFGGRVKNAIQTAIIPLRTIGDDLYVSFVKPLFSIERAYRIFGNKLAASIDNAARQGSRGGITDLFNAKSIDEAVEALNVIEEAIANNGKRFYNFIAITENAFRPLLISAETLALRIGIIDQRILRFRATSMEDFNFILEMVNELLEEVIRNIKSLSVIRTAVIGFIQFRQLVKRVMQAVVNDIVKAYDKITSLSKSLFNDMFSSAKKDLNNTAALVNDFVNTVEQAFFWMYDQIIANSWWTDLVEDVYYLADKWLSKTLGLVDNFSRSIEKSFTKAYEKVVPKIQSIFEAISSNVKSADIEIDVKGGFSDIIKDPVGYIAGGLREIFVAVGQPLGKAISNAYKELREISPFLTGIVTAIFGTKLISLISTSFAAGLSSIIRGGILAALALTFIDAFGEALLDSSAIADFASGIGAAAGKFLDLFISNIPEIIRAFGQIAVGFGQGLAESVSGIPGIILKGIMSIPLFNILPGLLAAGLTAYFTGIGPTKLVQGFISKRQKLFDDDVKTVSAKASKLGDKLSQSGPKISFLESALIGRGGARRSIAKFTTGIFLADTLLRGVFGNTAFTDIIIAGGIVLELLFGKKGISAVLGQVTGAFSILKNVIGDAIAVKSLSPITSLFASSASFIAEKFQFSMYAVGRVIGSVTSRLGFLGVKSKEVGKSLSTNLASPFQTAMYNMGVSLGKFSKRLGRLGKAAVIGGLAVAFASMAGEADAATSSAASSTEGMISRINKALESLLTNPLGMIGLMLFGGTAGAAVLSVVGKIGVSAGTMLGSALLKGIGKFAFVRGGLLALGILGSGSIMAGLGTVLAGVAAAVGAFFVSLAGIALAVASGVGLIAIALFGEGDTIGERFGNAYDSALKFFGGSSRAASKLQADLVKTLGSFDKIGDIDVDFKGLFETFDFEGISAKENKELQKIANRTNKILEGAQRNLEENGSITSAETRRVKRAVDLARTAIVEANKPKGIDDESGDGPTRVLTTLLSPFKNLFKENFDFRSQNVEIQTSLGLQDAVSDNLANAFNEVSAALSAGDSFSISSAIANILNDPAITGELSQSVSGSALVTALENIMAITSGINAEDLSPDLLNSLFTTLTSLGSEFDKSGSFGGLGFSIRSELANELLSSVANDVNTQITKVQGRIRSGAVQGFLDAATNLQNVVGDDIFDASNFDDTVLQRLGTKEMRDLTEQMTNQAANITKGLQEAFGGQNINMVSSEAREHIIDLYQAAAKTIEENVFDSLGLEKDGSVDDAIKTSFQEMNDRLEELGLNALKLVPSGEVSMKGLRNSNGRMVETNNQKILSQLAEIESLQNSINDASKTNSVVKNDQIILLGKEKALLEIMIALENARSLRLVDRIGAIENALTQVENAKTLDQAIRIDPARLTELLKLSATVDYLSASLRQIQLFGMGQVDLGIVQAIQRQIDEARKQLQEALGKGNTGDTSDDDKDKINPFEQFVERLSNADFSFSIEDAAKLGQKAFSRLKKPVSEVAALTKKIAESALDDVKGRTAAIKSLEKQKKIIFDILTKSGTNEQGNKALEAFGLDSRQVGTNENTLQIGQNILALQEKIAQLSFTDFANKQELTRELEYQETLLDNITTKAQAASDSIRDAFSESFKSLIKGESTIAEFFNSLLDSISNKIIDTVVDSFVEAFFRSAGLDTMFDTLFASLSQLGSSGGKDSGDNFKEGFGKVSENLLGDGDGAGTGFFSKLSTGFKDIFGGLGSTISGLFGGGAGGGFSFASLFSTGLGFFGFSEGGLVPSMAGSMAGRDSVPAMLTPGELVVPAKNIDDILGSNNRNNVSNSVVNLSITGDISRQTKQEIVKMLPTIATGVNAQNKEKNFRYK